MFPDPINAAELQAWEFVAMGGFVLLILTIGSLIAFMSPKEICCYAAKLAGFVKESHWKSATLVLVPIVVVAYFVGNIAYKLSDIWLDSDHMEIGYYSIKGLRL